MKYGCYEYNDLPSSYRNQANCSICENLKLSDYRTDFYGKKQCYCREKCQYIKENSDICEKVLIARNNYNRLGSYRPSGWYITTIICDILDNNGMGEKYNTNLTREIMIDFCINQLQNNVYTIDFLREYDLVGPIIASNIKKYDNSLELAIEIYEYYLVPFVCELQDNNYSNALIIYIDMIDDLNTKFNLSPLQMNSNNEYNLNNCGPQKLLMPSK